MDKNLENENLIFKRIIEIIEQPIVIFVDDFQILYKNTENYIFFQKLVSDNKIIEIITLPDTDLKDIIDKNPNFIKDAVLIQVNELSIEHLCELFVKRIYKYKSERVKSDIDWTKDILPFEKPALEKLAVISQGNPLDFIINCETAYSTLIKNHEKRISLDFLDKFMFKIEKNKKGNTYPNLTEKQTQIYSILLKHLEGIQLKEIKNQLESNYATSITLSRIIQQLNQIMKNKLADKRRKGKLFFIIQKL